MPETILFIILHNYLRNQIDQCFKIIRVFFSFEIKNFHLNNINVYCFNHIKIINYIIFFVQRLLDR